MLIFLPSRRVSVVEIWAQRTTQTSNDALVVQRIGRKLAEPVIEVRFFARAQRMKTLPEKDYRALFKITVILKGLIALGEVVLGVFLIFVSYDAMRRAGMALFGDELSEVPTDLIWQYAIKGFHGFITTPQSVWVFIFLSHGLVKLALIWGLLRDKLWAYPWSAGIFTFLVVYQLYQLTFTPSVILWLITILDVIVIMLVLHEYRYQLRHKRAVEKSVTLL